MEQCVFNKWEASNRCELCIIQRSLSLREREHGVRNTGWDQHECLCDNITSPEKVRRDKRNREELKERRTPAGGASRESKKERIRQHEDQTWINYNNMNPTKTCYLCSWHQLSSDWLPHTNIGCEELVGGACLLLRSILSEMTILRMYLFTHQLHYVNLCFICTSANQQCNYNKTV